MKILCIGFGKNYIKFGQLYVSYKKKELLHLSVLPIGDFSEDKTKEAILSHIETNGLFSEQYVALFDSKDCFIRHLNFPFSKKDKIKQVIKEEMELDLPVSFDDMSVDFMVGAKTKKDTYGVVGFAYYNKEIERILSVFEGLSIDLDFIMPDVAALKGLSDIYESNGVVFLGVKNEHTNYYQKCANNAVFLRSIHSPSDKVLSSVVSAYFKAQTIYAECSADMVVFDAPEGVVSKDALKDIFNCEVLSFEDYIKQFADMELYVDSLLSYSDIVSSLLLASNRGDVVNFRQGRYKKSSRIDSFKKPAMYLLVSVNLIFASCLFYEHTKADIANHKLYEYKQSVELILERNFKNIPKSLTPMQYKSLFLGKIKGLQGNNTTYKLPEYTFIESFNSISKSIPKDIKLTVDSVSYDGRGILISAKAESYGVVDRIKSSLSKVKNFKSIDIKKAKTLPSGGVLFDLYIEL